jgi:RNA polymerase sigma factor (sigma-70 family)
VTNAVDDLEMVARTKWNLLVSIAADYGQPAEAEDAVQAAFMAAWIKVRDGGTIEGDAVSYMIAILRYCAMTAMWPSNNRWKRRVRLVDHTAAYGEAGYMDPAMFADYDSDPSRAAAGEREDHARMVAEALAILTPKQRRMTELHWMNGMPAATAGEEMGLAFGAAQSMAQTSIRKLRRHFGQEEKRGRCRRRDDVDVTTLTEDTRLRVAEAARLVSEEKLTRQAAAERMGLSEGRFYVLLSYARAMGLMH